MGLPLWWHELALDPDRARSRRRELSDAAPTDHAGHQAGRVADHDASRPAGVLSATPARHGLGGRAHAPEGSDGW